MMHVFETIMLMSFVAGMVLLFLNPAIATIFLAGPAGAYVGNTITKWLISSYN